MNLECLLEPFADYLRSKDRSPRTIDTYAGALRLFLSFAADRREPVDPDHWTPATLTTYATWLKLHHTPASRAVYLSALSTLLRFLARNARLANPNVEALRAELAELIKGASAAANHAPLHQRLPEAEIVGLLLAACECPPALPAPSGEAEQTAGQRRRNTRAHLMWLRNRAMLHTLASSGMRVSELSGLTRGDLDRKQRAAHVLGKGGKWRLAPINSDGWTRIDAYLLERKDGHAAIALAHLPLFARHDSRAGRKPLPLSTRSVETILAETAERAGILDRFHLTPHGLRHFVATVFLANTGDLALTQELLGHADPRTTRRYAKTEEADLIAAHRAVFDRRK